MVVEGSKEECFLEEQQQLGGADGKTSLTSPEASADVCVVAQAGASSG